MDRTQSGIEFLRAMRDGTGPAVPMAEKLGFRLTGVEDGLATFEGAPDETMLNPLGLVHGGYYATLLDSAMGCAIQTRVPAGRSYTTIEFKVNLVRAVRPGEHVRAVGRARHVGRSTATAEGDLLGEGDRLLAHASTTCLVFEPPG